MNLYIMVSNDKYELPLAVADSVKELAEMTNKTSGTIYSAISHVKSGALKHSIYKKELSKANLGNIGIR